MTGGDRFCHASSINCDVAIVNVHLIAELDERSPQTKTTLQLFDRHSLLQ